MTRQPISMLLAGLATVAALSAPAAMAEPTPATPIKHVVFLMQENHSFDNYFGTYKGADGTPMNVCMPRSLSNPKKGCERPVHLGNRSVLDLGHNIQTFQSQFHGGKMDGFQDVFSGQAIQGALPMGYYDDRDMPYYWNIADNYVLFDRFFSSAHAGSVWNHMFWVTGSPGNPVFDSLPTKGTGKDAKIVGFGKLPTIFDRLEEKGISWKFYVQHYDPANTFRNRASGDRGSQIVWVPLLDYARYLDDPRLFSHIVPLEQYYIDAETGHLPAVSYIAPAGSSEHPPGRIQAGQTFVRGLVTELQRSSAWSSSAFIWSYDDWGGWYDHVKPPAVDKFGYGFRVPALLVSPYARHGYVDHTTLDYTSVLKFIEQNWTLQPLAARDRKATSIAGAFDFRKPARAPIFLSTARSAPVVPKVNTSIVYQAYGAAAVIPFAIVLLGGFLGLRSRSTRRRERLA